jgi:hypothetical protein
MNMGLADPLHVTSSRNPVMSLTAIGVSGESDSGNRSGAAWGRKSGLGRGGQSGNPEDVPVLPHTTDVRTG